MGKFSVEPSSTNGGNGLLDLSGLSGFTVRVAQVEIGVMGGRPNNVPVPILTKLATNNWIEASNVVVGASSYANGKCDLYLGMTNRILAETIVLVGGRYSGMVTLPSAARGFVAIRGITGGQSRASLYVGDQVGVSGLGYGGGSSACDGVVDLATAVVDFRLRKLVLGAGSAIGSLRHGVGMGRLIFGGSQSTVDVDEVYLGFVQRASDSALSPIPTNRGTLVMNNGHLIVNSNLFVGFSGDDDVGQTQRVAGVFSLHGGSVLTKGPVWLGWATNRTGEASGRLELSNGIFEVLGDIRSLGTTSTGTIYLSGATLKMNGKKIGSSARPVLFVAERGVVENVGQINDGMAVVKTGPGMLILRGTNTFTGPTWVSHGILRLEGQVVSSAVSIANSATLTGWGWMGNGLTVSTGALIQFMIGTQGQRIDVRGNLTLGGRLDLRDGGGVTNTTYTLFTYTGSLNYKPLVIGSVPTEDYTYTISTNVPGQVNLVVKFRDSVGDGIPDMWRRQHFGGDGRTTNAWSAAGADPDRDGHSNWQEYRAGTLPMQAESVLKLRVDTTGQYLRWPVVPERTYQIEYCDDLRSGKWVRWSQVQVAVPAGSSNDAVVPLPRAEVRSNRFYRVILVEP